MVVQQPPQGAGLLHGEMRQPPLRGGTSNPYGRLCVCACVRSGCVCVCVRACACVRARADLP